MNKTTYFIKILSVFLLSIILNNLAVADDLLIRKNLATQPELDENVFGIAAVNSPATPAELAIAMDIPQANISSASLGTSDSGAAGINVGNLGNIFPTEGDSFAILSTGLASTAETPNNSESTSSTLSGLNNSDGRDLVQLTLELDVPAGATCLSFDFAFYSEEYQEFVGSQFNDAFTAEYGGTDLNIINDQVVAPLNFAFDSEDNIISVNTTYGVSGNTGTTYDGVTPLITARSPIDPDASTVVIVFSIQDLGDSIYDSAVFLDNFSWKYGTDCTPGTDVDADGDGLLNDWETNGIDVDYDGTIDIDLPAMGADPNHKDIFVEIDYMVDNGTAGHTHKPKAAAIQAIIDSFADAPVSNPDGTTGITLHVDSGSDSIMDPNTGTTWGNLSESDALPHDNFLGMLSGGMYSWSEFSQIRESNFQVSRRDVFHYGIFAHNLGGGGWSGISRGIPESDFIVSLGYWSSSVGTVNDQAGTFMHELGHNLGLKHGGDDHARYKPNFLSVMNYSFQFRGLRFGGADGNFDYSRFDLSDLNENNLNETIGLNGGTSVNSYGTRYFCGTNEQIVNNANNAIDWNCNGNASETSIAADINKSSSRTVLTSHEEWSNIIFNGGAIGQLGETTDRPLETVIDCIPESEDKKIITTQGVSINGPGETVLCAGATTTYSFIVMNKGELDDSYTITADSSKGWADLNNIPININLQSGEEMSFDITLNIPDGADLGDKDILKLFVQSLSNQNISDSIEVITEVAQDTEPPNFVAMASPSELWPPNHKMIPVTVSVNGVDNCDPDFASSCSIISVTSDEPLNDIGDGNTDGDFLITGDLTVDLRAERAGPLKGRLYTLTVECADASGNTATKIATVNARHSKIAGTISGGIPAGETMSLYKASCGTNLLVETAIIDAAGNYGFELPLLRGNYTVTPQSPFGPELIEVMIPQLWFFGPYDLTVTD